LIGDEDRRIPRPLPDPGTAPEAGAVEPSAGITFESVAEPTRPDALAPTRGTTTWPRIWVETRTYEVRGFDDALGSHIRLGPIVSFGKLRVPSWISVEEPGRVEARFDVVNASQVVAPASAFSREWLFAAPDAAAPQPLPANP
jgi:hypothetical protein